MLPGNLHLKPGHLIRRAQQISVSIFLDECREYDITPMQYAVLAVLRSTPDLDQISLAHRAALDRSTIGGLAERLEEKGWLRRVPGVEDRRQKLLSLTEEGLRVLEAVEPAVERSQARILAPLTPEERAIFTALLERIVDENNEASRAPLKEGARP
ncbi:MarR family winged helix-turn-helix transcriptional regulator [Azospirillum halopraeferens]|uniref:MarR family winged helix-turn-helix transcriptional regulator n=1 Tax=Azospirillum halopraeferens TaxID=34010 RepID=UPI00041F3451|nr:MarR family transcriptional regulator [Azospirillum halopraeferens]